MFSLSTWPISHRPPLINATEDVTFMDTKKMKKSLTTTKRVAKASTAKASTEKASTARASTESASTEKASITERSTTATKWSGALLSALPFTLP